VEVEEAKNAYRILAVKHFENEYFEDQKGDGG
jgi:hypothetical protein